MLDESADADLVLVPLPDQPSAADGQFLTRVARVLGELHHVLIFRASSSFEEVLSGGHAASTSLLPGPEDDDERFRLPPLELPRPAVLQGYMADAAAAYERALAGLDEHCLSRLHSRNVELVRQVRGALEHQLEVLEKGLAGTNARRRHTLLHRFSSSFVIDVQAAIERHQHDGVPDQQAALEGRIGAFLDQESAIGLGKGGALIVEREASELTPDPTDPAHLRRLKRRLRARAWLGRRTPRYRLAPAALERHYFDRAKRELLEGPVRRMAIESHQLAVRVGQLLCASRAGITAIVAQAVDRDSADEALLAELKRSALEPFDELIERTKGRVRARRRDLLERAHAMLQQLAADLDRLDVARLARKQRRVARGAAAELRARLLELPATFAAISAGLYERARVGLAVSAFHQRLSAIVQRQQQAAALRLRNGALRSCEELQRALRELAVAAEDVPSTVLEPPKQLPAEGEPLTPKALATELIAETEPALRDLPETATLITDGVVTALEEGREVGLETSEIALRSLAQFLVESELAAGVAEQVEPAPELETHAATVARDVTRLVAFQLAELGTLSLASSAQRAEQLRPTLDNGIERLQAEIDALRQLGERVSRRFEAQLAKVVEGSDPQRLTEAGSQLGQHRRLRQGKIAVSGAQGLARRAQGAARQAAVSLLYRGSAGVVLARTLVARERHDASLVERLRAWVRQSSPQAETLDALPFYYRQLFFGHALNESFWVGRAKELAQARRAIQTHRDGQSGILLLVGRPGSGRSALCQRIARRALEAKNVWFLPPPAAGSAEVAVFRSALGRALGGSGELDDQLQALPEHAAIVIDDLELWWERSETGLAVIDELLELIRRHGRRILFVVSVNHYTFKLLSVLRPISDQALAVIECGPLDARELGSVLTLRHGSTGLKFELGGRQEERLSSFQLARLFSRHFSYSDGSVGGALRAWITHVDKVRDRVMSVRAPRRPSAEPLDELRASWRALLIELALHRRLTAPKLARIAALPLPEIESDLEALVRAGLITRGGQGLCEIDPFVRQLVTSHFEHRSLLPA